jgi:hypothetical protein
MAQEPDPLCVSDPAHMPVESLWDDSILDSLHQYGRTPESDGDGIRTLLKALHDSADNWMSTVARAKETSTSTTTTASTIPGLPRWTFATSGRCRPAPGPMAALCAAGCRIARTDACAVLLIAGAAAISSHLPPSRSWTSKRGVREQSTDRCRFQCRPSC